MSIHALLFIFLTAIGGILAKDHSTELSQGFIKQLFLFQ